MLPRTNPLTLHSQKTRIRRMDKSINECTAITSLGLVLRKSTTAKKNEVRSLITEIQKKNLSRRELNLAPRDKLAY